MAMGDPANEPGNPDGCRISKKKIGKLSSSLANLADMFTRASTLIEAAVNSIASSARRVGRGTGRSRSSGGPGETITTPEEFNKSVKRIKRAEEKKEKARAQEIYNANMASMKAERDAREDEEKEIIGNTMRLLGALNDSIQKAEKEAAAESARQEKEIIANAMKLLGALNDSIQKAEKEASEEAARQEKEIIGSATRLLSALNKSTRNAEKEAEAAARQEEKEIIKAAMGGLSARNAIRNQAEKAATDAAAEEEKEIIKAAMGGLSARNAIRRASEKEAEARRKFFEDQEKDIMRQAPIAYSIGKALGFLSGSLFKAASGLFSKGKGTQGKARGGWIQGFAQGGEPKGTDTVPAMLTPGEFVVNKKSAQKNRGILSSINKGTQYYAVGGLVAMAGRGAIAAGRGVAAAGRGAAAGAEASGMSGMANALTNTFNMISAAAGPLESSFKLLKFATLGPVDLFTKLIEFVSPFVQAVNPALMQQLGLVFKDLQAVIGTGLQPVIMAAIPIVRAFADRLQPIMAAMMPAFEGLASSMIELSGPVIEILIQSFAALEPVIEIISGLFSSWATMLSSNLELIVLAIRSTVTVFLTLFTTIQSFIGYLATWIPGFKSFGNKMMESANKSQTAVDSYWSGTSKVQNALQKPIQRNASLNAAAQPATFKGISEFGKGIMQQAFSSGTQAAADKTAENTGKMVDVLNKIDGRMGRVNPAAPAAGVRRGAA